MNSRPLILGHRGASAVAPENTLAAFSRAMADGADGIEFDVRLSRDQVPVVIHDANLKRTGLIDKAVGELTLAELQEIDVGHWFASRFKKHAQSSRVSYTGERLAGLSQVVELFSAGNGLLYIELKCEPREGAVLAAAVVRLIREGGMIDRVVVESFDLSAIEEIKRIESSIRTAALFEPKVSITTLRRLRMIDLAQQSGANEIALHHSLANRRMVEKAVANGFEVVVWTVDDARWIQQARTLGIKALIANNPAAMISHRNDLA